MHGGLFPVPNLSYIVVVLVVKYIHSLTFLTFESGVIEMALHVKCAWFSSEIADIDYHAEFASSNYHSVQ